MLKAILQSVTHNLQQLILTIMMTLVVVYLYTVIAFNFFRKFYVQEGEDGEEPDRKCHNMATCFIYHFYVGVRAGGGIGDELESPYGDELEYPRMFYDISFFFFVIIILLAIMQGLIIDAFGELRDQQESATEKLESSCFICDIGKDTFDRMPRGSSYKHLVNKDNTEYTGQETYVREKYDNRQVFLFCTIGIRILSEVYYFISTGGFGVKLRCMVWYKAELIKLRNLTFISLISQQISQNYV
ncbi:hypothetical protein KIN20_013190 [Parelaphostrongylus tenuis]|uniref:Ion transport domain-containing protein n=1 Tax=Parelaphostrongylus tenuis TaxID=148309 RepID=A0AAD5QMF8_PARTN|nr:hypothetical protein KIN20_013190 [Parelaphostrongylus tenuis]